MTDDSRSWVLLNYRLALTCFPSVARSRWVKAKCPDIRYGVTVANPHRRRIGGIRPGLQASRGHHALQQSPWEPRNSLRVSINSPIGFGGRAISTL